MSQKAIIYGDVGGGVDLLTPDKTQNASISSNTPVNIVTTQKPKYFVASCFEARMYGYLRVVDYESESGYYVNAISGSVDTFGASYINTYFPASDSGITFNLWGFMGGTSAKYAAMAVYY